jgi:hypothetical protein
MLQVGVTGINQPANQPLDVIICNNLDQWNRRAQHCSNLTLRETH